MTANKPAFGQEGTPGKVAILMLLPQCNMTCDYCVIEEHFSAVPWESAMAWIHSLKEKNYSNLILGGGEPTLWKFDVFRLAAAAKAAGLFVQIGTNAIRLPLNFENNPNIDRWILPLDGATALIHERTRHARTSHFERMREVLERLGQSGKNVYVSTVICQENREFLPQLRDYLEDYHQRYRNLQMWCLYQLLPLGRGPVENYDRLKIPHHEFESAAKEMIASPRSFKISVRRNMYGSDRVDFFAFEKGEIRLQEKFFDPRLWGEE